MHCLNCDTLVDGKYCKTCGQKTSVKRISAASILHELPHSLFHVDKGILKNITAVTKPKETVFSYLQGKRAGYYNPFLFFIITTAVVLFAEYAFGLNLKMTIPINIGEVTFDAGEWIGANRKYVFLLSLFLYALASWLMFKKSAQLNYAEHVVINLFILSWSNLLYLLTMPFHADSTYPVANVVLTATCVLYTTVFNKDNIYLSAIKSVLLVAIQTALFIGLTVVLAIVVSFIKYWDKIMGS